MMMVMVMIVIGGSSGIGKAAAYETLIHGGKVMLVSRSIEKLIQTKHELYQRYIIWYHHTNQKTDNKMNHDMNDMIQINALDITKEDDVKHFAEHMIQQNEWNCLVISAADRAIHGPMNQLSILDVKAFIDSKFWGAYCCAKYISPKLYQKKNDNDNNYQLQQNNNLLQSSSIIFVSGVLNRRPGINCIPLVISNGSLEALTRSLALELGPHIRVNFLCQGFTNTERFHHMNIYKRELMFDNTALSLPLQIIGKASDMGSAIYYLATATFVTGIVLDVDGGHMIRQYANPINDPMRK